MQQNNYTTDSVIERIASKITNAHVVVDEPAKFAIAS